MSVNVAIAGATGAVGQEFLNVLAERNFPIRNLRLLASAKSAGKTMTFKGQDYKVEELTNDSFKDVQIAFFSAGGSISKQFAPAAVAACATVRPSPGFSALLRSIARDPAAAAVPTATALTTGLRTLSMLRCPKNGTRSFVSRNPSE